MRRHTFVTCFKMMYCALWDWRDEYIYSIKLYITLPQGTAIQIAIICHRIANKGTASHWTRILFARMLFCIYALTKLGLFDDRDESNQHWLNDIECAFIQIKLCDFKTHLVHHFNWDLAINLSYKRNAGGRWHLLHSWTDTHNCIKQSNV